jgi:Ser/Thr protein kinase RdoA (MazF antagonist)
MPDFNQLDAEKQAQCMAKLAHQAVAEWGMDAAQLDLIKYRENAVFKLVSTDGTPYALRIHRAGYHTDAELESELQWMAVLEAADIHVPILVPTRHGANFAVVGVDAVPEPRQVDIFKWVDGEQLGSVEEGIADPQAIAEVYHTIGSLAAQLHNLATGWELPPGFTRHAWDADGLAGDKPFWGPFWELEALTAEQRELMIAARDRVHQDLAAYALAPENGDRYSMIHADFVAENLMRDGDTVRLIDFDDAGFGWHLFELATALYFEMEQDYYPAAYAALVRGYREHRSLPDSQLDQLPLFLLARSFTYLGWVHTRQETETARELTPMLVEKACNLARAYLAS